jgi:hypothetical protein
MGKKATVAPSDGVEVAQRRSFLSRLCSGDVGCALNLLCCPAVSLYHSVNIFVLPCIGIYIRSFLSWVLCGPCQKLMPCITRCFLYNDRRFPAKAASVGKWKDMEGSAVEEAVKWERAQHFYHSKLSEEEIKRGVRVKLFEKGIEPKDVAQGQVGNCWLIAALACVAEHPGLVRKAFVSKVASGRGKYAVRLYDWQQGRWTTVTVDENIPLQASDGTMLFAQPHGRELWVSMVEKAFAKFCGSYGALDGGQTAWAFNALTGDPVFKLKREGEGSAAAWKRLDMKVAADTSNKRACSFYHTDEQHTNSSTFFILRHYCKSQALLGASFGAYTPEEKGEGLNGESMGPQGLVAGHAYSILDCMSFGDRSQPGGRLKLIQLRNPWGKFEWTGAWSDGAPEWDANPKVRRLCRPATVDDGTFWMDWEDFSRIFHAIDVCSRSTGMRDLTLDAMEADGKWRNCLGPCFGCLLGCASFWCGCKGVKHLYFDVKAEERTVHVDSEKARDDDLLGSLLSSATDVATSLFSGKGDAEPREHSAPPSGASRCADGEMAAAAGSAPPPIGNSAEEDARAGGDEGAPPPSAQAPEAAIAMAPAAQHARPAVRAAALEAEVPHGTVTSTASDHLPTMTPVPRPVLAPVPIKPGLPTMGSGRPAPPVWKPKPLPKPLPPI